MHYYWATDQLDRRAAEREALGRCAGRAADDRHRGACVLGGSADGPAHWAVVAANNGGIGWSHAAEPQQAIDGAYKDCVKRSGGRCFGKAEATWADGVAGQGAATLDAAERKENDATTRPQVPAPPSGKWTPVGGSSELNLFVDLTSVKRSGDGVTAWVLYSLADESIANLNEHQCRTGQYRSLAWRHFDQPLGMGESQDAAQPEPWRALAADAFYRNAMRTVCRGAAPAKAKR